MNTDDVNIIDTIPAYSIEGGDQLIIEGDYIEVKSVSDGEDIDEVIVKGYSHVTGDSVTYELFADDEFDVWAL